MSKTPKSKLGNALGASMGRAEKAEAQAPVRASHHRPKVRRTTVTLTDGDFAALQTLKKRALAAGLETNISALVRAGIRVLDRSSAEELKSAIERAPGLPPGRPPHE